jgi:hypothetical protein
MLMGDDPEIEATAGRRMNVIDDVIDARQTVLFWRAGLVPAVDQHVDRPSVVPPSMTVTRAQKRMLTAPRRAGGSPCSGSIRRDLENGPPWPVSAKAAAFADIVDPPLRTQLRHRPCICDIRDNVGSRGGEARTLSRQAVGDAYFGT